MQDNEIKQALEGVLKSLWGLEAAADAEWNEMLPSIEAMIGKTLGQMVEEVKVGISNGYSLEAQLDIARRMIA